MEQARGKKRIMAEFTAPLWELLGDDGLAEIVGAERVVEGGLGEVSFRVFEDFAGEGGFGERDVVDEDGLGEVADGFSVREECGDVSGNGVEAVVGFVIELHVGIVAISKNNCFLGG